MGNYSRFEADLTDFVERYETMDESWIHHYQPETNQQSKQCKYTTTPPRKKAKSDSSAGKVISSVFEDFKRILSVDYLPKVQIMNGSCYSNLVRHINSNTSCTRAIRLCRSLLSPWRPYMTVALKLIEHPYQISISFHTRRKSCLPILIQIMMISFLPWITRYTTSNKPGYFVLFSDLIKCSDRCIDPTHRGRDSGMDHVCNIL